jgi:hypothetical protein
MMIKPHHFTLVLLCLGIHLLKLVLFSTTKLIDLNYNIKILEAELPALTTTSNNTSNLQEDDSTTSIVFVTGSSANHMETLLLDLLPSIE